MAIKELALHREIIRRGSFNGGYKMNNKERAISFLRLASSNQVNEAFERYIHLDFKHHLIYFKGDRESFKVAMEESSRQFPDKTYDVIHALEDQNFVTVHGKVEFDSKIYSVIHIFKFEKDKIIESWEASQENIENSPNENGLF